MTLRIEAGGDRTPILNTQLLTVNGRAPLETPPLPRRRPSSESRASQGVLYCSLLVVACSATLGMIQAFTIRERIRTCTALFTDYRTCSCSSTFACSLTRYSRNPILKCRDSRAEKYITFSLSSARVHRSVHHALRARYCNVTMLLLLLLLLLPGLSLLLLTLRGIEPQRTTEPLPRRCAHRNPRDHRGRKKVQAQPASLPSQSC